MTDNTTTTPAEATWGVEPTPPKTIRVVFGRRQFNAFLHSIHDTPGDSWKAAQIELKGGELGSRKFDRTEFFTDTLVGPIVAQREASTEDVHVTLHQPSEGIYRTADALYDAVRDGKFQRVAA